MTDGKRRDRQAILHKRRYAGGVTVTLTTTAPAAAAAVTATRPNAVVAESTTIAGS